MALSGLFLFFLLYFFLSCLFPPLSNFLKERRGFVLALLRILNIMSCNSGIEPVYIDSDIFWLFPGSPGYNPIWTHDRFHTCSLQFRWPVTFLSNPCSPDYWKRRLINRPKQVNPRLYFVVLSLFLSFFLCLCFSPKNDNERTTLLEGEHGNCL
jgi:hypothetical protein